MVRKVGTIPFIIGIVIILSIVVCKYFNRPGILLLVFIIGCILYQRDTNKRKNIKANFEDTCINLSKFIIVTGIVGYIVARVIGIFATGFS